MDQYVYQIGRDILRKSISKYASQLYGRMLDVGSGGRKSRYFELFKNIKEYVSLDVDSKSEPDIVGNAESMPMISDNSFDCILCTQTLCDTPHPEKAIKEFYRVLKLNGTLLLTVPFMHLYRDSSDYWRFTPGGVQLLLNENGFKILEMKNLTIGIFSVTLHFLNRFIKPTLSLNNRNVLRKIFNKTFYIFGILAIKLDKIFKSEINNKFFLNIIVLAKKS